MVRTRVGYAGGTSENPTYHNLSDHTESIEIDYDPTQISYAELLDIFWESHNPTQQPYSRQYMSIIFYHNEEQRQLAEETRAREEERRGSTIYTQILPYTDFYLAESYHQKYSLRSHNDFMNLFYDWYPDDNDFVNSTAAARLNGYLGYNGTVEALEAELDSLGLPQEQSQELLEFVKRYNQ